MVKGAQKIKYLTDTQNKEVIWLRSDLKYYRQISLSNLSVKTFTKTLVLRLGTVLPTIINSDQTCIAGRNIASN